MYKRWKEKKIFSSVSLQPPNPFPLLATPHTHAHAHRFNKAAPLPLCRDLIGGQQVSCNSSSSCNSCSSCQPLMFLHTSGASSRPAGDSVDPWGSFSRVKWVIWADSRSCQIHNGPVAFFIVQVVVALLELCCCVIECVYSLIFLEYLSFRVTEKILQSKDTASVLLFRSSLLHCTTSFCFFKIFLFFCNTSDWHKENENVRCV